MLNRLTPLFVVLLLIFPMMEVNAEWRISTVAGTGRSGNNGDQGPAVKSHVDQPFGVVIGPDRALYVTEVGSHRVRRIDRGTGRITTVAGNGRKGYDGDGGAATAASLNEPYEVRFDRDGNMFFVEMKNHLVRRVDHQSGIISTVAGTGKAGFGGDGGPATKAQLKNPHSIALADGALFIADIGNHRIRKVDLSSGKITTIAGNGEKKLPRDGQTAAGKPLLGPRALDIQGDTMWIALREGHSIWTLDLKRGILKHRAGTGSRGFSGDGGSALEATFNGPKGIAVGPQGHVYIVDTENQAIRRYNARKQTIETIAGLGPQARGYAGDDGPATKAKMDRPHGVCVDRRGVVYVGDTNNHRVRRIINTDN